MTTETRINLEQRIVRQLVADLLASGYRVVVDGREGFTGRTSDIDTIVREAAADDVTYLIVYNGGAQIGWVHLVYGNDGHDVISNYTMNLEPHMAGANAIADAQYYA